MFSFKRLRQKLFLGAFFVVVITVGLFATASYYFVLQPVSDRLIEGQLNGATTQVSHQIQFFVTRVKNLGRIAREWVRLGIFDNNDFDRFFEINSPILTKIAGPNVSSIVVADEMGNELIIIRQGDGSFLSRVTKPTLWKGKGLFYEHDASGKLVKKEFRPTDYDARERPWFKAGALVDGKDEIYITKPFLFKSTQEYGIAAVQAFKNPKGQKIRMAHDLRLIDFSRMTQSITAGRNGIATVFTEDGKIIGLPRDSRFNTEEEMKTAIMKTHSEVGNPILSAAFEVWQKTNKEYLSYVKFKVDGEAWTGDFRSEKIGEETYWVATLAPQSDFLPSWADYLLLIIGVAALTLFGAWFTVDRFAVGFAKPIEKLVKAREDSEAAAQEAVKQLENAAKAKTDFIARVSHEIRTPMTVITGLSYLGFTSKDPSKHQEYLKKISAAGTKISAIIDDLLQVSRLEIGKVRMMSKPFDLNETIHYVKNILSYRAEEKDLELVLQKVPEKVQYLVGDQLRLSQILINLLGNAINYTSEGEVRLRVEIVSCEENKKCSLRFTVEDTGIGIKKEDLDKLFKSFSQLNESIQTRHGGTGLGLVICKQFVELMGGQISVESTPGVGSRFSFTLEFPIRKPESLLMQEHPSNSLADVRVLVVDDQETNQLVAFEILRTAGCIPVKAENGRQALQILEEDKRPFDVILMDLQMPELDGIEATREIRTRLKLENVAILAMTAHASNETRTLCISTGMNDTVLKPLEPLVVLESIKKWSDNVKFLRSLAQLESGSFEAIRAFKRLNWNRDVLLHLIEKFNADYRDFSRTFRESLAGQKFPECVKLAHDLCGAAGNIGAIRVAAIAKELQTNAEKRNVEILDGKIASLEEELSEVLTRLSSVKGESRIPLSV